MPLDQAQQDAAKEAIGKHLKFCPICRGTTFVMSRELSYVPTIGKGRINLMSGQPCVCVVCTTCSYVHFFNVFTMNLGRVMGLREVPKEDTSPLPVVGADDGERS